MLSLCLFSVFSLVVVSLVELQACIVVTLETIRIKILTIVFPLLDIIILLDALVTNTLHKSIINIFHEHNSHFYMQSKVKAFTSHWINHASRDEVRISELSEIRIYSDNLTDRKSMPKIRIFE